MSAHILMSQDAKLNASVATSSGFVNSASSCDPCFDQSFPNVKMMQSPSFIPFSIQEIDKIRVKTHNPSHISTIDALRSQPIGPYENLRVVDGDKIFALSHHVSRLSASIARLISCAVDENPPSNTNIQSSSHTGMSVSPSQSSAILVNVNNPIDSMESSEPSDKLERDDIDVSSMAQPSNNELTSIHTSTITSNIVTKTTVAVASSNNGVSVLESENTFVVTTQRMEDETAVIPALTFTENATLDDINSIMLQNCPISEDTPVFSSPRDTVVLGSTDSTLTNISGISLSSSVTSPVDEEEDDEDENPFDRLQRLMRLCRPHALGIFLLSHVRHAILTYRSEAPAYFAERGGTFDPKAPLSVIFLVSILDNDDEDDCEEDDSDNEKEESDVETTADDMMRSTSRSISDVNTHPTLSRAESQIPSPRSSTNKKPSSNTNPIEQNSSNQGSNSTESNSDLFQIFVHVSPLDIPPGFLTNPSLPLDVSRETKSLENVRDQSQLQSSSQITTSLPPTCAATVRLNRRPTATMTDSFWLTASASLRAQLLPDEEEVVLLYRGEFLESLTANFLVFLPNKVIQTAKYGVLSGNMVRFVKLLCEKYGYTFIHKPPPLESVHLWEGAALCSTSRIITLVHSLRFPVKVTKQFDVLFPSAMKTIRDVQQSQQLEPSEQSRNGISSTCISPLPDGGFQAKFHYSMDSFPIMMQRLMIRELPSQSERFIKLSASTSTATPSVMASGITPQISQNSNSRSFTTTVTSNANSTGSISANSIVIPYPSVSTE